MLTLTGRSVVLEPLTLVHAPGLAEAAGESRDSFAFVHVPLNVAEAEDYVRAAQAGRGMQPYAIVLRDEGRVVGSTRFVRMEWWTRPQGGPPNVADIGHTWLAASAQGRGVNTEAKYVMLEHAFETWRVHRVALRIDARNTRSRRAVERLGASLEGVRRAEGLGADGTIRDSAWYSIVATEWPGARDRMRSLLGM